MSSMRSGIFVYNSQERLDDLERKMEEQKQKLENDPSNFNSYDRVSADYQKARLAMMNAKSSTQPAAPASQISTRSKGRCGL